MKRDPSWTDDDLARYERTRNALLALGVIGGAILAPVAYAASLSRKSKKKGLTDGEIALGGTLEQVSAATTNLSMVSLAAPAIALPLAYWLIEIGENWPPKRTIPGTKVFHPEEGYTRSVFVATGKSVIKGHGYSADAGYWQDEYTKTKDAYWETVGEHVTSQGIWSGKFGDTLQTLLAATVAAPAIGGAFNMVASAFKARTPVAKGK